jgi:hypothetical protein
MKNPREKFTKNTTKRQAELEKRRLERLKLWGIALGILLTVLKIALALVALFGGLLGL